MELTRVPSNSQRTTQASQATISSRLDGNASRQVSVQEIVNMKPQLSITSASYCYIESKPSDDEDNNHIDRVGVEKENTEDCEDGDGELIEPDN
jgi:hypothetical protein